jgi:hypothetical protein
MSGEQAIKWMCLSKEHGTVFMGLDGQALKVGFVLLYNMFQRTGYLTTSLREI